jgi:microcystin-dependent protein
LFGVVDTTYGQGDGSTTFNVPDLRGRVMIGASNSHPVASHGGEETHSLMENELPQHSHSVPQHGHANGITITTPALSHTITQAAFTYSGTSGSYSIENYSPTKGTFRGSTSTNATVKTKVAVDNHPASNCSVTGSIDDCDAFDTEIAGVGESHDNMQPFITMNYIIYTGA